MEEEEREKEELESNINENESMIDKLAVQSWMMPTSKLALAKASGSFKRKADKEKVSRDYISDVLA